METFSFGHGTTNMTRADEKTYSYPPLPGIVPSGGEISWPHTLKHLKLSNLALGTSTFTSNAMEMPALESILLKNCGNNVNTIINSLRNTHPGVDVKSNQAGSTRHREEDWE